MNFEALQKTWQAQPVGARVTIQPDVLLRDVRRNQQRFLAMIFWRDAREVVVCVVLAAYFGWHGWRHQEWTEGLLALTCLGLGAYLLMDHQCHCKRPLPNDSLQGCLAASLRQVNHQIWLLKNILWTYLLPLNVSLVIMVLVQASRSWHTRVAAGLDIVFVVGFCALISWGVYWLNQYAVRRQLEPRRRELEALLASLE